MKFLILKNEDIHKYLISDEIATLKYITRVIEVGRITDGKKPKNNYLVVNTDEPYANKVKAIIEEQEGEKIEFD